MDARVGQGDQEKVSKCLGFQVVWGSKSSGVPSRLGFQVVWGSKSSGVPSRLSSGVVVPKKSIQNGTLTIKAIPNQKQNQDNMQAYRGG